MKCKICGRGIYEYGQGLYYLADGKQFSVPFYYCNDCNIFIRDVDNNSIVSHLKSASHTNIKNEKRFYESRINFFKYLFSITSQHSNSISNWLDFGCSYGHFIEFLKSKNMNSDGIEINEGVRKYAQSKGLTIFEGIEELPEEKHYDVISLIDSIYYSDEPVELIRKLYSKTRENGLLVLRITNRNWLAKLKKRLLRKEIGSALGDATMSYSKKSITKLLKNNGFKIVNITCIEKGKSINTPTKIFYRLTAFLNTLSMGIINISPGLIIIARKNAAQRSS